MIIKELFAKLGLDVDAEGFVKGQALIEAAKFGLSKLGDAAQWVAGQLHETVMGTVELADKIDETAQSVGIATDALQELTYAAGFSGMGVDEVAGSMGKLIKTMHAAKEGNEEAAGAFAKVGAELLNADGTLRGADAVLSDIAEHFANMPDGAEKTALSMQLFGKSGASMIPFLNAGRDGIEELRKEAHEFGVVLDEEVIKKGAEVDDVMGRFDAVVRGLKMTVGGSLFDALSKAGAKMLEWVKANRELLAQRIEKVLALMALAASVLLVVLDGMYKTLGFIIDNWKYLAILLGGYVLAVLFMNAGAVASLTSGYIAAGSAAVAAGARAALAWVAASWPVLLLTGIFALVILLIEDIITALDGGESILGHWLGKDWIETIRKWRDAFKEFWDWLKEESSSTWDSMQRGFDKVFGTSISEGGDKGYKDDKGLGPGVWRRNEKGELRFFPFDKEEGVDFIPEGGDMGFKDDKGQGSGTWSRIGNGELRFFPSAGASPEGSASAANYSSSTMSSTAYSVEINVNPPAGSNATEIANTTRDVLDEQFRATDRALEGGGGTY